MIYRQVHHAGTHSDLDAEYDVRIAADASVAPGGDRSSTGLGIKVWDVIVHQSSSR